MQVRINRTTLSRTSSQPSNVVAKPVAGRPEAKSGRNTPNAVSRSTNFNSSFLSETASSQNKRKTSIPSTTSTVKKYIKNKKVSVMKRLPNSQSTKTLYKTSSNPSLNSTQVPKQSTVLAMPIPEVSHFNQTSKTALSFRSLFNVCFFH